MNVTTINLQLYNSSTKDSVEALVCSCGTTELCKAAILWKTTMFSSLILLKEYFNNRMDEIKFSFHKYEYNR
jgi:hypothetical protein